MTKSKKREYLQGHRFAMSRRFQFPTNTSIEETLDNLQSYVDVSSRPEQPFGGLKLQKKTDDLYEFSFLNGAGKYTGKLETSFNQTIISGECFALAPFVYMYMAFLIGAPAVCGVMFIQQPLGFMLLLVMLASIFATGLIHFLKSSERNRIFEHFVLVMQVEDTPQKRKKDTKQKRYPQQERHHQQKRKKRQR